MRVAGISIITPSNANVATIAIIAIDVVFVLPLPVSIPASINGCKPFFLLSSSTKIFHYQATFRTYDRE
jgi:hypothetical protein